MGGVISVQAGLAFIVENSQIQDISSPSSTLLHSVSAEFTLNITGSTIACDSTYDSPTVGSKFRSGAVTLKSTNTFYLSGN